MPASEADFSLALAAAQEAGEIALGFFRRGPKWRRKADGTPVCEADLAVDAALRESLLDARPDYGWLSEETADSPARLSRRRLWVLDPVDGTSGFLSGDDRWCVSLALVEDGRPVIGVIHAPALGRTWAARRGHGATCNGAPIRVSSRTELAGARIIGPRSVLDASCWAEPWPQVRLSRPPSLALRLAFVASADADAMLAPGPKSDWDIAAGDIIVREAGGRVTDAGGEEIRYNRADTRPFGVVAAGPALHEEIVSRLRTHRCRGRRPQDRGKENQP